MVTDGSTGCIRSELRGNCVYMSLLPEHRTEAVRTVKKGMQRKTSRERTKG
jgi:hypothetical protein